MKLQSFIYSKNQTPETEHKSIGTVKKRKHYDFHTQLFLRAKSCSRKENSPAVSRLSVISGASLTLSSSSSSSESSSVGNGTAAVSLAVVIPSGVSVDMARALMLPTFALFALLSQRKTCTRIGTLAWRCNDSFWLSETVSKHRIAPVEDTIHGSTLWFDIRDTTSRRDDWDACLYRLLSPDRAVGESSSASITDDM